ncbi:Detected protein of confused Function [Hibiscus syriacus]|uniref:Detected protein of confused Function n=1 Tax=Hibiscus syriacus TaxID=106335 RepID=A0A6A3CZ83_HIBSY|nr:Detected protein of confused Function [Hibiscus syriacus]
MQLRAGNMLPPPLDDYCPTPTSSASAVKPIAKNAPNNKTVCVPKGSPPNGSTGRTVALPAGASWGMLALNQPQPIGLACSNGPSKQKSDMIRSTLPFSSAATNTNQDCTMHGDVTKRSYEDIHDMQMKDKPDLLKSSKQNAGLDSRTALEKPTSPGGVSSSKSLHSLISSPPVSYYNEQNSNMPSTFTSSTFDHAEQSLISISQKPGNTLSTDGKVQSLCSDMSKLTVDRKVLSVQPDVLGPSSSASDHGLSSSPRSQGLQEFYADNCQNPLGTTAIGRTVMSRNGLRISKEQSDWRTERQTPAVTNMSSEVEEDILSFDNQRHKDPEVFCRRSYVPNSPISLSLSNQSRSHLFPHGAVDLNSDPLFVDNKVSDSLRLHGSSASTLSNGYPNVYISSSIGSDSNTEGSFMLPNEGMGKEFGRFLGNVESNDAIQTGESSIISNILSLDFDTWNEYLASPHNLAKLLGDTYRQPGNLKLSTSWKAPNHDQQMPQNLPSSQNFAEDSGDMYLNKFGISNGLSSNHYEEPDNYISGHSVFSSYKFPVSRSQISAPPGFSVPSSRAPPPGFFSRGKIDHAFDTTCGNRLVDSSSLLRNSYQAPSASGGMGGSEDIEFMDPAILAVGKGRHPGGLNKIPLQIKQSDMMLEIALLVMLQLLLGDWINHT